jgi:hypothetical protein
VQVFIEIPEGVSGKPTAEYCFTARVIHVETDRPVAGKIGVGVNFYSYVRVAKSKQGEGECGLQPHQDHFDRR